MEEEKTPRTQELPDHELIDTDEPDWQARGEHPLEGGQTDAVDDLQGKDDLQDKDASLADGSSYRKEADGLGDLIDDGSNYREIAKADD